MNNDRSRNQQQRSGAQELDGQLFTETGVRIDDIPHPETVILEVPWDDVLPEDMLGDDAIPKVTRGEEIPADYIPCAVCQGDGCRACGYLGAIDPQDKDLAEALLLMVAAMDKIFDRLVQSLPPEQGYLACLATAKELWRWIDRWHEEGVISDCDTARVSRRLLAELGFPTLETCGQA